MIIFLINEYVQFSTDFNKDNYQQSMAFLHFSSISCLLKAKL